MGMGIMYLIKTYWSGTEMYYTGNGYWAVKDTPFYDHCKYTKEEGMKEILKLKDKDPQRIYILEPVGI